MRNTLETSQLKHLEDMFESDDFDQVLSQFDFPEVVPVEVEDHDIHNPDHLISKAQETQAIISKKADRVRVASCDNTINENTLPNYNESKITCDRQDTAVEKTSEAVKVPKLDVFVSPKHTKRKIINSYFDHKSKRKFPGPAGLLTGALEEPKDESICQIELLSQDIDCTPHLRRDIFHSPIWNRLLNDTRAWELHDIDSIKIIKQQALSGHLRRGKAQTVTAIVEAVDRSAVDPLIILRDDTGTIKCTLHRDAWSNFSPYIVSDYCALVLQKPTVFTTGAAFKKHYLNITLSNILAIYSSNVLNDNGSKTLPDGYTVVYDKEFTVIKTERSNSLGIEQNNGAEDLLDDLNSIFSDDTF